MEVLVALGIFAIGLVAVAAIFPTAITIQRETVREADGRRIGKNARAIVLATARTNTTKPLEQDKPQFEMSYTPAVITPPTASKGSLKPFVSAALGASASNPTPVMPMIDLPEITATGPGPAAAQRSAGLTLDAPASFHGLIPLSVRSYPQNTNQSPSGTVRGIFRRDYYWYPLLQVKNLTDPAGPSFSMFIIVMHRGGSERPPEVRRSFRLDPTRTIGNVIAFNAAQGLFNDGSGNVNNDNDANGLPDFIQPGDLVLGDDGRVHRVILADATSITVNSDNVGNPSTIYFGVSIERTTATTNTIKREGASPVVWIEESIPLSINP